MRDFYGSNNPNYRSHHITKDVVCNLYLKQEKSTTECAKILNIGRTTFGRHMKRFGIKARSISEACQGEKSSGWKGGRVTTVKCGFCGNDFETATWFVERGWGKYCSNECSINARDKRIEKICVYCGGKYKTQLYRENTHKYCSYECKSRDQLLGSNVRCDVCNKQIYRPQTVLKRHVRFFCSPECRTLGQLGPQNSQWLGGKSSEPYCFVWRDKTFKQFILDRDEHKCQNPDCWGNTDRLCIHHIDFDKKNCHPDNLVTLCVSCNSRANTEREWHTAYYNAFMQRSDKTINNLTI